VDGNSGLEMSLGGTCKFVYFSGDCAAAGVTQATILKSAIRADLGLSVATRDSFGQTEPARLGPRTRAQASSEQTVSRKPAIRNGPLASFLVLRTARDGVRLRFDDQLAFHAIVAKPAKLRAHEIVSARLLRNEINDLIDTF
jgi:hypothetical protein